jgi:hypothetical protein
VVNFLYVMPDRASLLQLLIHHPWSVESDALLQIHAVALWIPLGNTLRINNRSTFFH